MFCQLLKPVKASKICDAKCARQLLLRLENGGPSRRLFVCDCQQLFIKFFAAVRPCESLVSDG